MEPKANRVLRHFPYQHPVFGRAGASWQGSEGVRRSPYYWWWEYLRRSEKYKTTCKSNGTTGLKSLYRDFGNIYRSTFKEWWSQGDRGAMLFANASPDDLVVLLDPGTKVPKDNSLLTVKIPLALPRKHIEDKLRKILDKHHQGRRGVRYTGGTTAQYRISKSVNLAALETRLKIYDDRLANSKKTLWQLGLDNVPALRGEKLVTRNGKPYLDPSRRNVISALVSRYLREAKATIKNVESGIFP